MPGTAMRPHGLPIPAHPGPEPFGAASGPWRSPSLLPTDPGAMHVEEAPGATREGMPLLIPLARGDVSSEGDDLRISVELLPIALGTPAFHPFFRFPRGHQVSALDPSMRFRRDHAS
jgi:hypothetical protein